MALELIKQVQHNVAAKFVGVVSGTAKSLADCIDPVLEAIRELRDMRAERKEVEMPYVKPVRRVLGTRWVKHELADSRVKWVQEEDYCYDIPLEHFPLDILLWGPVFLTSALRFEAANQAVIQAGRATNFISLLKSTAEKVALRRALELKKDPNDRHSIQIRRRLTETVNRGTSSTMDAMWAGGWLPLHSESVEVVWVASIEYAHYRIDVHSWLRLVVDQTESLAKIDDLFQVGGILYALLSFYPGALQQDAATGQLFASLSSIGPDVQFPARQQTIRRFDHIPDLLLLHQDHGRQCYLFFPW